MTVKHLSLAIFNIDMLYGQVCYNQAKAKEQEFKAKKIQQNNQVEYDLLGETE